MRHNPSYAITDPREVARLIRDNPWAIIVSTTSGGLVASHYPFLLDESAGGAIGDAAISIVSHVGRPDEVLHQLGTSEVLVIVQGEQGYVSPSWHANGDVIPTWNYVTAHLYGTPEILRPEENLRELTRLVGYFEQHVAEPIDLTAHAELAREAAMRTVGIRIRVDRFVAKAKLSQDKPAGVREKVIRELRSDGPFRSDDLADRMSRPDRPRP